MIQLEIFLTSPGATGRSLRIAAEGRVLRVEHPAKGKARGGFAVASESFEIRDVGSEPN
jgi:hypothetical protein